MSKGKVLAVVNMKGGVGKTTTVVSICETLAARGNPVLVVDVDAQANASYCLAGDKLLSELIETNRTVDAFFEEELIDNKRASIDKLIRDQVSEVTHLGQNLDISLASSANLRLTEREIICALTERGFSLNGIEGQTKSLLKRHLDELRKSYSYIIFDCAPGISAFTTAAVSLADLVIVPVCVQNHYNLVHRDDDAMIDALAEVGIAYVPYFPLGGFTPLQAAELIRVAGAMERTPQSVALAWLLQRSPNILLIPGTSRRAHLRDNIAAAGLALSREHLRCLNGIAAIP